MELKKKLPLFRDFWKNGAMKKNALIGLLALVLASCGSADSFVTVFAQVEGDPVSSTDSCSTTCVTSVFNDSAKTKAVLQASSTSPQGCDSALFLLPQSWQISEFNLGETSVCTVLGDNNPTELLCEVQNGGVVVHTYLGEGELPFVPQGCGRTNLDLNIIIEDLSDLDSDSLSSFSCETLSLAYLDNDCTPQDFANPVCAALNGIAPEGFSTCP